MYVLAGVMLATALIHILADAAGDLSNPCLQLSTGACVRPRALLIETARRSPIVCLVHGAQRRR